MVNLIPAECFKDLTVTDMDGNELGNGESFVVDLTHGEVVVVVISFRGKLIGIPWALVQPPEAPGSTGRADTITLKTDASHLGNAPVFPAGGKPASSLWQDWGRRVYQHFDLGIPWGEPEGPGAALDAPPGP